MAAVTTFSGFDVPAYPSTRRHVPRGATPRGRRTNRAMYLRRRLAVVGLALALVLVAAQAGAALGGSPLAAPERRPASPDHAVALDAADGRLAAASSTVRAVTVRPGDSLWSIAERLHPGEDPRPVVDEVDRARHGAPLVAGETILWPR